MLILLSRSTDKYIIIFRVVQKNPQDLYLPTKKGQRHSLAENRVQNLLADNHTFKKGFHDRKIFKRSKDVAFAQQKLELTLTNLHGQSIIAETDSATGEHVDPRAQDMSDLGVYTR